MHAVTICERSKRPIMEFDRVKLIETVGYLGLFSHYFR